MKQREVVILILALVGLAYLGRRAPSGLPPVIGQGGVINPIGGGTLGGWTGSGTTVPLPVPFPCYIDPTTGLCFATDVQYQPLPLAPLSPDVQLALQATGPVATSGAGSTGVPGSFNPYGSV